MWGQGHLWGKEGQSSSKWSSLFWSQCRFKCWTKSQWALALEMLRCPNLGSMNIWARMGWDGMNHPVKPKQRSWSQAKQLPGTAWVSSRDSNGFGSWSCCGHCHRHLTVVLWSSLYHNKYHSFHAHGNLKVTQLLTWSGNSIPDLGVEVQSLIQGGIQAARPLSVPASQITSSTSGFLGSFIPR